MSGADGYIHHGIWSNPENVSAWLTLVPPYYVARDGNFVAAWLGVSAGEDHWIQVGISVAFKGSPMLYVESKKDGWGSYETKTLGPAIPGTPCHFSILRTRSGVWKARVMGAIVGTVSKKMTESFVGVESYGAGNKIRARAATVGKGFPTHATFRIGA